VTGRSVSWLVAGAVLVAVTAGLLVFWLARKEEYPPPTRPGAPTLVRQGAESVAIRYGDLDGDGVEEVVLSSASRKANDLGLPTPYLEVFEYRQGGWRRIFDATVAAPRGSGILGRMLEPADAGFTQSVHVLDLVDFASDGSSEIVAAIASAGATAGPLELWVVSLRADGTFATEFYESSSRGGLLDVLGDTLRFEFGVYRKRDPGCCPSLIETQTIGFDPSTGRIEVLERTRERTESP
jgi:hypothetical protein